MDRIIGIIHKNSRAQVRIQLRYYRSQLRCDIRTYYLNEQGKWVPSCQGISSIAESSIPPLEYYLRKARIELGLPEYTGSDEDSEVSVSARDGVDDVSEG